MLTSHWLIIQYQAIRSHQYSWLSDEQHIRGVAHKHHSINYLISPSQSIQNFTKVSGFLFVSEFSNLSIVVFVQDYCSDDLTFGFLDNEQVCYSDRQNILFAELTDCRPYCKSTSHTKDLKETGANSEEPMDTDEPLSLPIINPGGSKVWQSSVRSNYHVLQRSISGSITLLFSLFCVNTFTYRKLSSACQLVKLQPLQCPQRCLDNYLKLWTGTVQKYDLFNSVCKFG